MDTYLILQWIIMKASFFLFLSPLDCILENYLLTIQR